MNRKPIGLVCAARHDGSSMVLTAAEVQLVRQLRDAAVAALTRAVP